MMRSYSPYRTYSDASERRNSSSIAESIAPVLGILARRRANCSVLPSCSRMRKSSAERDSTTASLSPWRISTRNQLSMPRLRNSSEKTYTDNSGMATRAPKTNTVRVVKREPGAPLRYASINCMILRSSKPSSTTTATALANKIHGCHLPNCAEFCAERYRAISAPNTSSAQNAAHKIRR